VSGSSAVQGVRARLRAFALRLLITGGLTVIAWLAGSAVASAASADSLTAASLPGMSHESMTGPVLPFEQVMSTAPLTAGFSGQGATFGLADGMLAAPCAPPPTAVAAQLSGQGASFAVGSMSTSVDLPNGSSSGPSPSVVSVGVPGDWSDRSGWGDISAGALWPGSTATHWSDPPAWTPRLPASGGGAMPPPAAAAAPAPMERPNPARAPDGAGKATPWPRAAPPVHHRTAAAAPARAPRTGSAGPDLGPNAPQPPPPAPAQAPAVPTASIGGHDLGGGLRSLHALLVQQPPAPPSATARVIRAAGDRARAADIGLPSTSPD
jgi:hypothetical protein